MDQNQISRFRSFNRTLTVEIGALDESFLSRGRPLGAARVLNAIGQGYENVSDIREYLKLDTGLLSRLLRSLEKEGLVETRQNSVDRRSRIANLTEAGQAEFEIYEDLSNDRAKQVLAGHKNSAQLLEAMDTINFAFSRDRITFKEVDYTSEVATYCLEQFAAELSERFETGFDLENSGDPDPSSMRDPLGTFVVASLDENAIGCVGVKGNGGSIAEIKRMWVAPSARGLGLARQLMASAEKAARNLSITTLRLDTNQTLVEAVNLYRNLGWREIDRFNDDPYPDIFFEKHL